MSRTGQCAGEADVPNIDGANVPSISDKVDLAIVSESTNTTKFVAIDHSKHKTGSDSDAKLYRIASEMVVSPTESTEAILLINTSTAIAVDGNSPSPSSQTAVSTVRINHLCTVQTELEIPEILKCMMTT